jgi:hypothetical protein
MTTLFTIDVEKWEVDREEQSEVEMEFLLQQTNWVEDANAPKNGHGCGIGTALTAGFGGRCEQRVRKSKVVRRKKL